MWTPIWHFAAFVGGCWVVVLGVFFSWWFIRGRKHRDRVG
jgi:hypothetical protein